MSLITRSNLFDVDRFFNNAWPQPASAEEPSFFAPRVDIRDADEHYEITAELPGVSKDNIHVHIKDGVLTLEAESEVKNAEEAQGRVIRRERRYGKFMRSFNLGTDVKESDIQASFENGVLTLRAPKQLEKEPERRRIEIN
ncbi:MAG: Hsp20/alpha crystallin family protein [Gammaproteobacteria bacterium]|jgi:HSP20 family protein|nr:Hsp20/alpha crystallin family protein [Gammaproteobacteria bacterium]